MEIEFYLPQIAHLIIHAERNINTQGLEMLAMVISQTSIHSALQLAFMFAAAMEDYQPEIGNGQPNPSRDVFYFNRCARLLQDLERAVICGSPNITATEENALLRRVAQSDDVDDLRDFKRNEIAHALSQEESTKNFEGEMSGILCYKRTERKSAFHSKPWKQRHFVVDQRVLLCFSEPHSVNPIRAIPLQYCRVEVCPKSLKYGDTCFDVINDATGVLYHLRANDTVTRSKWVDFLNR